MSGRSEGWVLVQMGFDFGPRGNLVPFDQWFNTEDRRYGSRSYATVFPTKKAAQAAIKRFELSNASVERSAA